MLITVHAEKREDAEKAMRQVRDEILKDFKSIMIQPYQSVIDLLDRAIRIDFRCGGYERLSGIRPSYFYCCDYTPEVQLMLQYGADKCNGRGLNSLEEIRDVVIEFLDNMKEVNDID